jgi:hypothetical protein
MLDGTEDIETAVERVVNDRENAAEEEGKQTQT